MPLDKNTLVNDLINMRKSMATKKDTGDSDYANALANAIEKYVKSGTVEIIIQSGAITVAGSATTQKNVSPITIDGNPTASTGGIK